MPTQTPPEKSTRVNVEIDPVLRDRVNQARVREGRTLQKIFDLALREWLKNNHPDLLPAN